jgi:AAA+ superfamily predicted ATPase
VDERRTELERVLLSDPFDAASRCAYAELLFGAGELEAALAQFELLAARSETAASGLVGAARCLHALGRSKEALARYARARTEPGFAADLDLERLAADAQPASAEPAGLRVIAGGGGQVVPLQAVSAERVRFSSIVGMAELKKTIRLQIIEPFLNPGLFARFKKRAGGGILLYGPPGCGKTMLARAIAHECNTSFVAVGISDVLNLWLGESERNLAGMFEKARSQKPCVLFFDELDALAFSRSKASSSTTRTLVNEFLSQLDGLGRDNDAVLVLAATNMPWDVDPAMKRPGRFSRQIFVPPPDAEARAEMLALKLTGVPHEIESFPALSASLEHYSGADIDGLIELAKERALADSLESGRERPLSNEDLSSAASAMTPSTLDWLRTIRNLVKYGGSDPSYRDVESYLKRVKLL